MSDSLTDGEAFEAEPNVQDESTAGASSASDSASDNDAQVAKEPTIDAYEAARESLAENSTDSEDGSQDQEDASAAANTEENAEEEDDLPDEISDDELKGYKPKTRKRIEKLLSDVKGRDDKIAALQVPAEEYSKIENYLRQTNTTMQMAGDAVELAALIQNNPEEAWKRMVPVMQELGQRVGAFLPKDISEQVKNGYMTREAGAELAKARAGQKLAQEQQQRHAQLSEQQQREQQNQTVRAMDSAATERFQSLASSDPDFEMKRTRIAEKVQIALQEALRSGKPPRSVAEAVGMVDKAYAAVNAEMKQFLRKPAVTPVDGGSRSQADAPPRSSMEAAKRALAAGA